MIVESIGRRHKEIEDRYKRDLRGRFAEIVRWIDNESNSPRRWKENKSIVDDFKMRVKSSKNAK